MKRILSAAVLWGATVLTCIIAHPTDNTPIKPLADSLVACIQRGESAAYPELLLALDERMIDLSDTQDDELFDVYRAMEAYYKTIEQDYTSARLLADKELSLAEAKGDSTRVLEALKHLTDIFKLHQPAEIFQVAQRYYNLSHELADSTSIYLSSARLAIFHFYADSIEQALKYMNEARVVAHERNMYERMQYMCSFIGELYTKIGDTENARLYYEMSLIDIPETPAYERLYAHFTYVKQHAVAGRYPEALAALDKMEAVYRQAPIRTFFPYILDLRAYVYECTGRYKEAVALQHQISDMRDSLAQENAEQALRTLELKNELKRNEDLLNKQQIDLMNEERMLIILRCILALLVLTLIYVIIGIRRRNRNHKEIVERQLSKIKYEQRLRAELEEAHRKLAETAKTGEEQKYSGSSLTEEQGNQLFQQLDALMHEQQIFTDQYLSIDTVAERLGTNRTYLSKVVNKITGDSFPQYVNRYRAEMAMQLLSDPNNHDSLKEIATQVGLNPGTTFNTVFKKQVGVAPSVFRENVQIANQE